jgi:transcriptional regulator with XRE-family HTH domain
MNTMPDLFHIGKKIKKIREFKGIKQEVLASGLGITHQAVSKIEQSSTIDEETLKKIAEILDVPVDAIKNFNEEAVIFNIQNMNENSSANYQYTVNPMEKIIELYESRIIDFEKRLKEKDEIIAMLKEQKN